MTTRAPVIDPMVLAIYKGVGTRDPAWSSFPVFRDWALANGYADHLTLDRIDFNGGYWPDNCRWITNAAQQRNKSNNFIVEVDGESMVLADAAKRFGVCKPTIKRRILAGWPAELAVQQVFGRTSAALYEKYRAAG